MRRSLVTLVTALLAVSPVAATQPQSTASASAPATAAGNAPGGPSPLPSPPGLVPARFGAADFAAVTEAQAARALGAFPRLVAWLESRKPQVLAAQQVAAKRALTASRGTALVGLEAWLASPLLPAERAQALAYLGMPPEQLLRDLTLLAASLDELTMREQAAEVRASTESEHAQLAKIADDPAIPEAERAQLKAELVALKQTESELATTGQPVPAPALDVVAKHREKIREVLSWTWASAKTR